MAKKIRVRMYNVGLGDCFLLTFPGDDGERRVLVDCGTHPSGPGPQKTSEVVERIIEDVRDTDGTARIDVVIATHRHRDHVSGFESEAWSEVEVREVWMPWTEDPDDPEGREILAKQAAKAKKLHDSLTLAAAPRSEIEIVENSLTNAEAMNTLHHGFSGSPRRRFLPKKGGSRSFRTAALPGVKVHVLGPSRDPEVIRDMKPPKGESYLRLADGSLPDDYEPPFGERWRVSPPEGGIEAWWDAAAAASPREKEADSMKSFVASLGVTSRWLRDIDSAAADDALALVVAIDKAVNGTSLMLMFEAGKSFLLFPGDAQWGTWQAAMAKDRAILERTSFLKVGHHGSHNATPMDFVEELLEDGFRGMVCTRKTEKFPEIPRLPLLARLREKGTIVRSDKPEEGEEFTKFKKLYVETLLPW